MAEVHILFYPFEFRVGFYEGCAVLISSKNATVEAKLFDDMTVHNKIFGDCWCTLGSCTTTLVRSKDSIIIVDPGATSVGYSALRARLSQLNLTPEDISCVVNTHLHGDHAGSNSIFRGKPLLIHEKEIRSENVSELSRAYIANMVVKQFSGDKQVTEDIQLIETPGHTPGSITVLVDTPKGLVAIAGDAIMAKEHFLQRKLPEWEPNSELIFKSMDKIEGFKPKIIVPGHDFPFTLPPSRIDVFHS
jgi:glyoxylase-like metal-dependent hydrolase (beta-lactamase superfamily II)